MKLGREGLLYALTITCSSALLFLVQPMLAKAILPRFGGSAGVWVTCMLFFQVVLLIGYLYAYWITRHLNRRVQTAIHLVLLVLSLSALPLHLPIERTPTSGAGPSLAILWLLVASVGLPYFLLCTTSPLLQSWYAARGARFPYRLFALSNAASLAALFAYPVGIEPLLSGKHQLAAWSGAYLVVVLLASLSALRMGGNKVVDDHADFIGPENRPWLWIALAACASALWLAVANHLSQEVAPIPFLWVLPLGLYLLSFILCFEGSGWYRPLLFRWLLPAAWIAVCFRIALEGSIGGLEWEIPVFSAALLICCMFCHGELAESKPDPRRGLAFFYLMIALGGALGAVFVGLVAPNVFSTYLELPVGITACVLLALALLFGFPARRLVRLGLFAVLAFVFATRYGSGDAQVVRTRNFYGALQVRDRGAGETAVRALYNGRTLHGVQFLSPSRSRLATAFFSAESGVGRVLESRRTPGRRVAIIGLGAGTLATYGRRGDYFRFYEINPAVIQVASRAFRFLAESQARTDVVLGDGRLALQQEPLQSFDVIVLDAFSDDSIPIHLLTREAFEGYFQRLRGGGILAIHITSRYLDLDPVVEALAGSLQKNVLLIYNQPDPGREVSAADWAILSEEVMHDLVPYSHPPAMARKVRPWTDDYSNLFQVLR
ncbi:MAG: fused MFS/spermidine synthase [Acidobacteriia bacterium]|nr:fused MFS/spermidine synthase [Terriglobia bacterium]